MQKLKHLSLSVNPLAANAITALPTSLQSFSAHDVNFSEIPLVLKDCRRLASLTITNATISAIPDWIGSLDCLKWINLKNNKISLLPVLLSTLPVLKNLNLTHNNIDSIPTEIFGMAALSELSVSNNPIRHLPGTVQQAKSLYQLHIENTLIPPNEYKKYRRELAHQPVIIVADDKKSRHLEWSNRIGPCYQEDEIFDYEVFTKTEIAASFKGVTGTFFNRELRFPDPEVPENFSDTVVLKFVVKPWGGITRITVLKSAFEATKNEAIRLTKLSCPYWKPGISGGQELPTWCTLQLVFNSYRNQQQPAKMSLVVTKLPQVNYSPVPAQPL